jgi:hypothetical protein
VSKKPVSSFAKSVISSVVPDSPGSYRRRCWDTYNGTASDVAVVVVVVVVVAVLSAEH